MHFVPHAVYCNDFSTHKGSPYLIDAPTLDCTRQTVEITELSPNGLLLMRVFFHEIIATGDDASFMEVGAIFVLLQSTALGAQ